MKNPVIFLNTFVITVLFISTTGLYAQDVDSIVQEKNIYSLDLEDLMQMEVVTASKKSEKQTDAPGIIDVVTKQEIEAFGARNLIDVLERTPSLQIIGSHLNVQNVSSIRGDLFIHTDNHVLILLNGRPVREGITGGLNNNFYSSFPIELIDHIEIIRGPGSVLYGSNAFVGVINIITETPEADERISSISFRKGSFKGNLNSASASMKQGDLELIFGTQYFEDEGWTYTAYTNHPSPALTDSLGTMNYGGRRFGASGMMRYKNLSLSAYYSSFYHEIPGVLPYWTNKGNVDQEQVFVDLGYVFKLSELWDLNTNITYNYFDYFINSGGDKPHNNHDILGELSLSGKLFNNLGLISGIVIDSRNNFKVPEGHAPIPVTWNQLHFSVYAQLNYNLFDKLKLIGGFQMNVPDKGDVRIVPRAGLIAYATDNIGLKCLYAEAFRSPRPVEQIIDLPSVLIGEPNLNPEKIKTIDVQAFYSSEKAKLGVTYFNSHYSDLINRIPVTEGSGQTFTNKGSLDIHGVEFETKVSLLSKLLFLGSATIQKNQQDKTYAPQTMFKAGISYKFPFGVSCGVFNTYYDKSKHNEGAELNKSPNAVNLLSLNFNYKLPGKNPLELNLYFYNLLNQEYWFTEFSKGWVNTLPLESEKAIYGGIKIKF